MPLSLMQNDKLARAISDLRLGLPILLEGGTSSVAAVAVESCSNKRIAAFLARSSPVLILTRRRAETLKARSYDGAIARISVPEEFACEWVRAVADPSRDLQYPMKGPLFSYRGGSTRLHELAVRLARRADAARERCL